MIFLNEGREVEPEQKYKYNIFPNSFDDFNSAFNCVNKILCELARKNELWLTEIENQGDISCIARIVLCGYTIMEGKFVLIPYPKELENYRVKIKSLNGEPIRYKIGISKYTDIIDGQKVSLYKDDFEEITLDNEGCILVPIPEAIMILEQNGKHFRVSGNSHYRKKVWTCEEVHPLDYKNDRLLNLLIDLKNTYNI